MMKKIILVIGGTGMLGQPVSYSLKEAGFQIRIMTRDHQKARKIFDDSFEIFAGGPTDSGCLEEALNGCYGVHISLPTEVEQQVAETVAKVASRHGVERITYISGATVAEENRWFPMINRKFLAEQAIRKAGIPYTILGPTWVMDGLRRGSMVSECRTAQPKLPDVCGRWNWRGWQEHRHPLYLYAFHMGKLEDARHLADCLLSAPGRIQR